MTDRVEAIYENGQLRLLTPLKLAEGQRVQVAIDAIPSDQALQHALGDLVAQWLDPSDNHDAELEALADEIDQAFRGVNPCRRPSLKIVARHDRLFLGFQRPNQTLHYRNWYNMGS